MAQITPVHWEFVPDAPDDGKICPVVRVIDKEDGVYIYQYQAKNPQSYLPEKSPIVSVSRDGIHFTTLGRLPDSLGKIEILFAWKNEIYIRAITATNTYLKTTDGITFVPFLHQRRPKKYIYPTALGVMHDTLYAYCRMENYRDSLYYLTPDGWKADYSVPYRPDGINIYYTPVVTQGKLILQSGSNYHEYTSLRHAPVITPVADAKFYPDLISLAGKYVISYNKLYSSQGTSMYHLTDLANNVVKPILLPPKIMVNNNSPYKSLMVMPDSSLLLRGEQYSVSNPNNRLIYYYTSPDYGETWKVLDSISYTSTPKYQQVYTYQHDWYFTNTSFPYHRSSDQGEHWQEVTFLGLRKDVSFAADRGKMVLNNEYFSSDDGKTWTVLNEAFPGYSASDMIYANGDLGWFFKSPRPDVPSAKNRLLLKPDSHVPEVLGGDDILFDNALPVQGELIALRKGPIYPQTGEYWQLQKFDRATRSFQYHVNLREAVDASGQNAADLLSDGTNLYFYTRDNYNVLYGLYVSTNLGATWTLLQPPASLISGKVPNIAFYTDKRNGVYALMGETNYDDPNRTELIDTVRSFRMTKDGYVPIACDGLDKRGRRNEMTGYSIFSNLSKCASGNSYSWSQPLGGTLSYLFKSSDDGEHWERLQTDEIPGTIVSMAESSNGTLYVATSMGLMREKKEEVVTGLFSDTEQKDPAALLFYPNPASASIIVNSMVGESIQVLDLSGRVLIDAISSGRDTHVPIHHLTQGIYLVKSGTSAARLLVQ